MMTALCPDDQASLLCDDHFRHKTREYLELYLLTLYQSRNTMSLMNEKVCDVGLEVKALVRCALASKWQDVITHSYLNVHHHNEITVSSKDVFHVSKAYLGAIHTLYAKAR